MFFFAFIVFLFCPIWCSEISILPFVTEQAKVDREGYGSAIAGNPLQILSHYQDFIDQSIAPVKGLLSEVNANIARFQQVTYSENISQREKDFQAAYIQSLHTLQDVLLSIDRMKIDLDASIGSYRRLIDEYLAKVFSESIPDVPDKASLDDIKGCVEKITFLEKSIVDNNISLEEVTQEKQTRETVLKHFVETSPERANKDRKKHSAQVSQYYKKAEDIISQIHHYKKLLFTLRLKEKEFELRIYETRKSILREELKRAKEAFKIARERLVIDDIYVQKIISEEKVIQANLMAEKESLLNDLESLELEFQKEKYLLNDEKEQLKYIESNFEKASYEKIDLIFLLIKKLFFTAKREYIESQLFNLHSKFKCSQHRVAILRSWHLILTHKKITENDLKVAITALEPDVLQADVEEANKKKVYITNILQEQMAIQASLQQIMSVLHKSQLLNTKRMQELELQLKERYDLLVSAIELYDFDISMLVKIIPQAKHVLVELKTKGFWTRSQYSIGLTELENFFPDMKLFFKSTLWGFKPFVKNCWSYMTLEKQLSSAVFLKMILAWCIALLIAILGAFIAPRIQIFLVSKASQVPSVARLQLFIGFLLQEAKLIYIWCAAFVMIKAGVVPSVYAMILFYLFSIPYLLLLGVLFFAWFENINSKKGFIFVGADYARRFILIISGLAYASIIIYFTREAFLISGIVHSQVPTILLAAHFILVQISLILLLHKEQLLHLIPKESVFWNWFHSLLNEYYFFFLIGIIAVIIMSNPYVGYGSQVLYVLTRTALTALIIPVFSHLHDFFKEGVSNIFFYQTEQDTIQNRIPGGRGWYALVTVCLFALLFALCYIMVWRIWGIEINLSDLKHYLDFNILEPATTVTEKIDTITVMDIIRVVYYVVCGKIAAFFLNTFILKRIFTPILVGSGVQNTMVTLSRYILVACAFLLGLYKVGLEGLTTKIFALIVGIGFAIKEPVADLISYFILLVQRPIKIGDFVRINISSSPDGDVQGLVRQITPRATLIRQRNSQTIIVPNSILLTRAVTNWNYIRGFVAAEDIFLHVSFEHDPEVVRSLLQKVVESHPAVLKNPAPIVWCHNFTPSGYQFLVRGFIASDRAAEQFEIGSQIRILLVKKLRQAQITISAPHVYIKSNFVDNEQKFMDYFHKDSGQ